LFFIGRISTQHYNEDKPTYSGLSITVRYGSYNGGYWNNDVKEITLNADSNGFVIIKDIDCEAVFFPKLISHISGWIMKSREASGHAIEPGLVFTGTPLGNGFSCQEERSGIRICSIFITLTIDENGKAQWSFSNSVRDTENALTEYIPTLPKKDPLRKQFEAYLKASSSE
jgi:hypothetical protein